MLWQRHCWQVTRTAARSAAAERLRRSLAPEARGKPRRIEAFIRSAVLQVIELVSRWPRRCGSL